MSRLRLRHSVALAAALLALAVPAAIAAFVATTSNTGNSFQSAAIFPGAIKMATGSYLGNAGDNRAIPAGFQPDVVIVKDTNTNVGVARTSTMTGDVAKPMGTATALQADNIQSLTATGFTIGTNARVNQSGRTYHWVAFKTNGQAMRVGTYNGNAANRSFTGFGFSPEAVILMGNNAARAVSRLSGMTRSYGFDASTGTTTGVTSLDADGFSVGTAAEANASGIAYHYVAFNDVANSIDIASYAGNNADNRTVATVGFQPEYVLIRANDTATGRSANARPASLAGDSTQLFTATANANNRIQALQANGFQLGTQTDVNASTVNYHYLAVRSSAP
jgi:hypothetical protein